MDEEFQYAQYERARALLELNRYNEAIKAVEEYIRTYPEDADGYTLLGKIYLYTNESEKALHWVYEAMKKDPESWFAWQTYIGALYTIKDWTTLPKALENALSLYPEDDYFYMIKCCGEIREEDFEQAEISIKKALRIEPENAFYLSIYSYILSIQERDEESRECEVQALKNSVENEYVFLYCAWAADYRGELELSREYLKNAIRLNPTNDQIRENYLDALQKQYWFYRIFVPPTNTKTSTIVVMVIIWIIAWLIYKPLIFVFIFLYVLSYWSSKLIVHVKVFGWNFRKN